MKIVNSKDPSIDPWGTPVEIKTFKMGLTHKQKCILFKLIKPDVAHRRYKAYHDEILVFSQLQMLFS